MIYLTWSQDNRREIWFVGRIRKTLRLQTEPGAMLIQLPILAPNRTV